LGALGAFALVEEEYCPFGAFGAFGAFDFDDCPY
jgi:hypothetical protein